jgi:hypothetical protein
MNNQPSKVIEGEKVSLAATAPSTLSEDEKTKLLTSLTENFSKAQISVFDANFLMAPRGEFESNEEYIARTTSLKNKFFFFDLEVDLRKYNYDKTCFDDIRLSYSKNLGDAAYLNIILDRQTKPIGEVFNKPVFVKGYSLKYVNYWKGIIAKNISAPQMGQPVFFFSSSEAVKFYWTDEGFGMHPEFVVNVSPKAAKELKEHNLIMRWKIIFPYSLGEHITNTGSTVFNVASVDETTDATTGHSMINQEYVLADILAVALIDKTENKILAIFSMTSNNQQ